MTDDDTPLTANRRAVNAFLAGAGLLGLVGTQSESVAAQSGTEPRIRIGQDWAIDDDTNGVLSIKHTPTGASFEYDSNKGAWIPTAPIGTANDRENIYGDTGDFNSVETKELNTTNETKVIATRSSDSASTSAGTWINAFDGSSTDVRGEYTGVQFVPDRDGTYLCIINAEFGTGGTTAGDATQSRIQDVDASTMISLSQESAENEFHNPSHALFADLTAGTTYELQVRNADSSYVIEGKDLTKGLITRVMA